MSKRGLSSFISCFAATGVMLCCSASAEGASPGKTTSLGTLVLVCAGVIVLGVIAGIFLRRH